jgi:hypothetical protein
MRYALVETVMKKVFEGSAGVKLNGSAPSRRSINWRGTGLGAHRYQYLMRAMSRVVDTGTEAGAPPGRGRKCVI